MNYSQLKKYIDNTKLVGAKTSKRLLVDLYQKTTLPFTSFIILLVGVPIALRIRRGGAMISIGLGLMIVAGYYVLIAITTALGKGGAVPPLLAVIFPHAVFIGIGLKLLQKYI